jgi:hypothetical protein
MADPTPPSHDPSIAPEDSRPVSTTEEPARLGDFVRRAVMAGVGAVFLTEEGIRKTVSELKLPKEALGYLSTQAERTRTEAGRVIRKEMRRFLNSDAFKQQIAHFLSGVTLEIKAEIRLKPDPAGPKPEVSAQVDVKHASKKGEKAD